MQVPAQSRAKLVSWPDQRLEDLTNKVVFILGGSEYEEAIVFAERHMESGAKVVMAFRSLESLGYARSMSQSRGLDSLHLLHLEPLRRESADRCFDYIRDHFGRLDGILVLPRYGNGQHGYSLSTAGDDDVAGLCARPDRLARCLRLGTGEQPRSLGFSPRRPRADLHHQPQRRTWRPVQRHQPRRDRGADSYLAP